MTGRHLAHEDDEPEFWWIGREFPEFEHLRAGATQMFEEWHRDDGDPQDLVDWVFAMMHVTKHGLPEGEL